MIDFGRLTQQSSFVKGILKRAGLPSDIGDAIAALAKTIRDHKHFETLLTSTDAESRQLLYDALRPHLRFQAKPLDMYVSSAGQMAEREQLPILGEGGKLLPFRPAQDVKTAEHAIAAAIAQRKLTLTCSKCTEQEEFFQVGLETAVDVRMKALKSGWVLVPKEVCPKCPATRPQ